MYTTGAEPSQEDINKELGVGAVSADMELDALKDASDAEILAVANGLGRYVPLIASFCRSRSAIEVPQKRLEAESKSPGCRRQPGAHRSLIASFCRSMSSFLELVILHISFNKMA